MPSLAVSAAPVKTLALANGRLLRVDMTTAFHAVDPTCNTPTELIDACQSIISVTYALLLRTVMPRRVVPAQVAEAATPFEFDWAPDGRGGVDIKLSNTTMQEASMGDEYYGSIHVTAEDLAEAARLGTVSTRGVIPLRGRNCTATLSPNGRLVVLLVRTPQPVDEWLVMDRMKSRLGDKTETGMDVWRTAREIAACELVLDIRHT